MASTLVGLFDDRDAAQNAVNDLIAAGISRDNISIVANNGSEVTKESVDSGGSMAAEGLSSGLSSGAIVGGIAGLLIGLGFVTLPFGGFLVAGPLAGLLTGALAGAATGGIVGGLIGLGIPNEHAELYAEGVRRGGTLVTVHVEDGMEQRVMNILDRDGAVDIETRAAAWRSRGYTGYDAKAPLYTDAQIAEERAYYNQPVVSGYAGLEGGTATTSGTDYGTRPATSGTAPLNDTDKLEVVQEELAVGKREVQTGGVRVRSFVTEKPVTEQVTLRQEQVEVNRTPVDRPASGADFVEGEIEVRTTGEVPVVSKEARVVEEISLDKTHTEHTETVQDTVRRQDVEIEQVDATHKVNDPHR